MKGFTKMWLYVVVNHPEMGMGYDPATLERIPNLNELCHKTGIVTNVDMLRVINSYNKSYFKEYDSGLRETILCYYMLKTYNEVWEDNKWVEQ